VGSITKEKGFIPSEKQQLKIKSSKTYYNKQVYSLEYSFSMWLINTLEKEGILEDLKRLFPDLWQFIVSMIYCRVAYQSPLKNIPFHLQQSDILKLLGWSEKVDDPKIGDLLFELGCREQSIHRFMQPKDSQTKTILIDATDIVLQSNHISLSKEGYNSRMDFQPQFVLLYLYDAVFLRPLYYRMLPGNIREISAMKNTIKISGLEHCAYIADKGLFSEANVSELERMGMQYMIPLKRNNQQINYKALENIEQTDNYFEFSKRFIFHADTKETGNRRIEVFLDGKLKEQEKADYLSRIQSLPENFSKHRFNELVKTMGTLAIIHNTQNTPKELYHEYKSRGDIEQFFDHLKNTLNASSSSMQREKSLNGWMFINHLSMLVIYRLFEILKTTPLNKQDKLLHKYSLMDAVVHLKSVKKIKFAPDESVIAEINKSTKKLLEKMKISIT